MTVVFADTAFYVAAASPRDELHQAAVRFLAGYRGRTVTTEFVLTEVGDGLASVRMRLDAARVIDVLRANPLVETVPASSRLFAAALRLYRDRPDKEWGLTDCASFVVMRERGLTAALTRARDRSPKRSARPPDGACATRSATGIGAGR